MAKRTVSQAFDALSTLQQNIRSIETDTDRAIDGHQVLAQPTPTGHFPPRHWTKRQHAESKWNESKLELDAHRERLIADVTGLVEKYRSIFGWDIPDIDPRLSDQLILSAIRKALDQLETSLQAPDHQSMEKRK